jgi:ribosome recycling factor
MDQSNRGRIFERRFVGSCWVPHFLSDDPNGLREFRAFETSLCRDARYFHAQSILPSGFSRIAVGSCSNYEDNPMASFMDGNPALKGLSSDLKRRMDQAVATFQASLASTRTGRASVHMLDQVKVDYYGTPMPVNQLAQVSTPEPQLILIVPYDPTVVKEIEKALSGADLGLNPQSDGKVIRVPIPPMTEERRRDVVKHLKRVLEEHRTAIRNVRRDGNDALKKLAKEKKISEDDEKRALEEVQKMTDEEIRRMEELSVKKEIEVMQV